MALLLSLPLLMHFLSGQTINRSSCFCLCLAALREKNFTLPASGGIGQTFSGMHTAPAPRVPFRPALVTLLFALGPWRLWKIGASALVGADPGGC